MHMDVWIAAGDGETEKMEARGPDVVSPFREKASKDGGKLTSDVLVTLDPKEHSVTWRSRWWK